MGGIVRACGSAAIVALLCALPLVSLCSTNAQATMPGFPNDFTARPGPTYVVLTWTPPDNVDEVPVTGYALYIGTVDQWVGQYPFADPPLAVLGPEARTFTPTGLTPLVKYHFGLLAIGGDEKSNHWGYAWAIPGLGAPDAPHSLAARPTSDNVAIYFSDGDEGGCQVIGHHIWREASTGPSVLIATTRWETSYVDENVQKGETYSYSATSFNAAGESGYSNSAIVRCLEGPENLTANPAWVDTADPVMIQLNWTFPVEMEPNITCFKVSGYDQPLIVDKHNRTANISTGSGGWGYQFHVSALYATGEEIYAFVYVAAPMYEGVNTDPSLLWLMIITFLAIVMAAVYIRGRRG